MHIVSAFGGQAALTYIKRTQNARSPSDSARVAAKLGDLGVSGAGAKAFCVPASDPGRRRYFYLFEGDEMRKLKLKCAGIRRFRSRKYISVDRDSSVRR